VKRQPKPSRKQEKAGPEDPWLYLDKPIFKILAFLISLFGSALIYVFIEHIKPPVIADPGLIVLNPPYVDFDAPSLEYSFTITNRQPTNRYNVWIKLQPSSEPLCRRLVIEPAKLPKDYVEYPSKYVCTDMLRIDGRTERKAAAVWLYLYKLEANETKPFVLKMIEPSIMKSWSRPARCLISVIGCGQEEPVPLSRNIIKDANQNYVYEVTPYLRYPERMYIRSRSPLVINKEIHFTPPNLPQTTY
jgi:hypothetical protein